MRKKNQSSRVRRKGKLRYSSKRYTNPFFTQKKKKRRWTGNKPATLKTKLLSAATLLIGLSLAWALFYSPYFEIDNVIISGGGRINPGEVEKLTWQQINDNFLVILPQRNIFLFNKKRLIRSMSLKYAFNELTIQKKFPQTLRINYQEKVYALIWQEGDTYYYTDSNGAVINEANLLEVEHRDYPIVENRTNQMIYNEKIVINQATINFILDLFNAFKTSETDFKVVRFVIDNDQNTLRAILEAGPEVLFNTRSGIEKQLEKLIIIKNEKLMDDFINKSYIDVRYGESVYYR